MSSAIFDPDFYNYLAETPIHTGTHFGLGGRI
jgi:hypothetical protein